MKQGKRIIRIILMIQLLLEHFVELMRMGSSSILMPSFKGILVGRCSSKNKLRRRKI